MRRILDVVLRALIVGAAGVAVFASSIWPNEPRGFVPFNDQSWVRMTRSVSTNSESPVARIIERVHGLLFSQAESDGAWSYLRRSSSKDADIIADATAPISPPNVLRIVFTPDMRRDHEPSVHWIALPRVKEIYTAWSMKLSSNWTPSPAGGGKITFLWPPEGHGVIYSNIGGSSAPHRINIATTWTPYGYRFWEPNVTTTSITYDRWHRIEWYVKWASAPEAADGIVRWWVDGVLNGDYQRVQFPPCCMQQFEFAPTRQNPPPTEQYMYVDHTYVSIKTAS